MRSCARHALVVTTLLLASRVAPAAPPPKPAPQKPAPKPAPAKPAPPKPPPLPPLSPLALLPSIARVKVTSHGKAISVVEDVNLPRGDWNGEPLRFHVGFGAPGPRAIDAHLVEVGDGELEADDDAVGEALTTERVPRRPPSAHPLLGRETMAGIVVTIPPSAFAKALTRGNMAALRIRSLVDVPEVDASGASSVVVRLGMSRGTPLTLGRIVATSVAPAPAIANVEAKLCGPEAEARPLAVGLLPHPAERRSSKDTDAPIAPVLSVRHATDDLCVRLWLAETKTP